MKHRILICGDRFWADKELIRAALEEFGLENIECVIEGEAPGADSLAREAAEELGIPVLKFPADWKKFGRAAGPIRNQQMLNEGKPTLVWAFHDHIEASRGTADMVRRANKANLEPAIHSHKA